MWAHGLNYTIARCTTYEMTLKVLVQEKQLKEMLIFACFKETRLHSSECPFFNPSSPKGVATTPLMD